MFQSPRSLVRSALSCFGLPPRFAALLAGCLALLALSGIWSAALAASDLLPVPSEDTDSIPWNLEADKLTSFNHIAVLNPESGEVEDLPGGQGFGKGSSWARGQAWAVYGFAISHAHTKEQKYLDAAKRAAHYFIAGAAVHDFLPLCDFRAPEEPLYYDSTAGACAVCGLLEIAIHVPELEKPLYEQAALRMLRAMEAKFCNWNEEEDGILGMGKVAYHEQGDRQQGSIIYGDYFFAEAVLRLMEKDFFIW